MGRPLAEVVAEPTHEGVSVALKRHPRASKSLFPLIHQHAERHAEETHTACLQHQLAGHPERPARLEAVLNRLYADDLFPKTKDVIPQITTDALCLVHPSYFINQVANAEPLTGTAHLDPDTYLSRGSMQAALMAASANLEATRLVLDGIAERVFCAVRPPGHHAEQAEAMGFCLFNNIAMAAERALQDARINRVAILDFDVHHCNGTVKITTFLKLI